MQFTWGQMFSNPEVRTETFLDDFLWRRMRFKDYLRSWRRIRTALGAAWVALDSNEHGPMLRPKGAQASRESKLKEIRREVSSIHLYLQNWCQVCSARSARQR